MSLLVLPSVAHTVRQVTVCDQMSVIRSAQPLSTVLPWLSKVWGDEF